MGTEGNGELPCGEHTGPLGITHLAENGLQGRGVMIDLRHHLGPGRHAVGYYTLMRIIDADDIAVEPGDILCLYSGFGDILLAADQRSVVQMRPARCAELDGRDEHLLRWIEESDCAAIASDSPAVELVPAREVPNASCAEFPLHELCLRRLGIALGGLWYLSELARWLRAHHRRYFLLTAPASPRAGIGTSPLAPIATV